MQLHETNPVQSSVAVRQEDTLWHVAAHLPMQAGMCGHSNPRIYKKGKYVVRYNGEWRDDTPTVSQPTARKPDPSRQDPDTALLLPGSWHLLHGQRGHVRGRLGERVTARERACSIWWQAHRWIWRRRVRRALGKRHEVSPPENWRPGPPTTYLMLLSQLQPEFWKPPSASYSSSKSNAGSEVLF
jgi:hypothetical protein